MTFRGQGASEQVIGGMGTVATWTLAVTGWTLHDVQVVVGILSGCAAMAVSLVTLWFMIRKRKG